MYLQAIVGFMNRSWAVSCLLNVGWTAGWVSTHIHINLKLYRGGVGVGDVRRVRCT